MKDYTKLGINETLEVVLNKEKSCTELVNIFNDKIDKDTLNAFITKCPNEALTKAEIVDQKIKNGKEVGKLAGVCFVAKDAFCTKGIRTTCGSKMLENFIPSYESTVTQKLLDEDAIMIAKANQDQFCMGSTGKTSYFGNTINPYKNKKNPEKDLVPGGSSSGSAVATATDSCIFALGTDTGGSVKQPAAFCGLYGIRPSYGRNSRHGVIPFSNSLDQPAVFTKNSEDIATIMSVISGPDEKDMTTYYKKDFDFIDKNYSLKGKKIGVLKETFDNGVFDCIKTRISGLVEFLKKSGADVHEIETPFSNKYGLDVYYVIACSEVSTNLSKFDGFKFGGLNDNFANIYELYLKNRTECFGEEVKRRIVLGNLMTYESEYNDVFVKAAKIRAKMCQEFDSVLNGLDFILTATTPNLAFEIDKVMSPVEVWLSDIFTIPSNIVGVPSMNIPVGLDNDTSLPIGCQLIGNRFDEKEIISASHFIEKNFVC